MWRPLISVDISCPQGQASGGSKPCVQYLDERSCCSNHRDVCRSGGGFFGAKAGAFTNLFSRAGSGAAPPSPMGEASIHSGGVGGFRQVQGDPLNAWACKSCTTAALIGKAR